MGAFAQFNWLPVLPFPDLVALVTALPNCDIHWVLCQSLFEMCLVVASSLFTFHLFTSQIQSASFDPTTAWVSHVSKVR